ncbi:hypothetical protein BJF84_25395 [Rhodococcus sp. CUA-806]|nr:hypothetical protein BJF84_25395 [Rhodococcus sp. CUA-806]
MRRVPHELRDGPTCPASIHDLFLVHCLADIRGLADRYWCGMVGAASGAMSLGRGLFAFTASAAALGQGSAIRPVSACGRIAVCGASVGRVAVIGSCCGRPTRPGLLGARAILSDPIAALLGSLTRFLRAVED